jgi:hypothetical protein
VVVAALLSSVRLASLSMEMERSGEDKQAASERGERRGTVLVSVRRVAELGRKESGQPNGWSGWFV